MKKARDGLVYVNGKLLPSAAARVSVLDRGFAYGDGVFETMYAREGKVFKLEEHLERLLEGARALSIPVRRSAGEIARSVRLVLSANELSEAYIKITLTRGTGGAGPSPAGRFRTTLIIYAREFHGYPGRLYSTGMSLATWGRRVGPDAFLRRFKTCNYLENIMARKDALDRGAHESLLLDTNGSVLEASASNVFIVEDGTVVTPPLGLPILPGITRRVVLRLCRAAGIEHDEQEFGAGRLMAADEVFLTNSLMGVMPVRSVDGVRIGGGSPGPVTCRLMKLYDREVGK